MGAGLLSLLSEESRVDLPAARHLPAQPGTRHERGGPDEKRGDPKRPGEGMVPRQQADVAEDPVPVVDRVGKESHQRELASAGVAHVGRETVKGGCEPGAGHRDPEVVALALENPGSRERRGHLDGAPGGNRESRTAPGEEKVTQLMHAERDARKEVAAQRIRQPPNSGPGDVKNERGAPGPGAASSPGAGIAHEIEEETQKGGPRRRRRDGGREDSQA